MKIGDEKITPFLMDYGWAILVILAAVGAIIYFSPWGEQPDHDAECRNQCSLEGQLYGGYQTHTENKTVECFCVDELPNISISPRNQSG